MFNSQICIFLVFDLFVILTDLNYLYINFDLYYEQHGQFFIIYLLWAFI